MQAHVQCCPTPSLLGICVWNAQRHRLPHFGRWWVQLRAWAAMAHPNQQPHLTKHCHKQHQSNSLPCVQLSHTVNCRHQCGDMQPMTDAAAAGSNLLQQPSCVTVLACPLHPGATAAAPAAAESPARHLPSHCWSKAPTCCASHSCQGPAAAVVSMRASHGAAAAASVAP